MNENEIQVMRDKILKGIDLSFRNLLKHKIEKNENLIISKNGKIIKIKAVDIDKEMEL